MRILVGIDDTDTKETRGTGFNAREIGKLVENEKIGIVEGIVRHQLFFDPRIPYTSANSSASIEVECSDPEKLKEICIEYLNRIAPIGSDVGLCIAEINSIPDEVIKWGDRAKVEVLTQKEGRDLAKRSSIYLEGLCGTEDGTIGALAAIGLRKGGSDGRFIWLKGKQELRDIPSGIYTIGQLKEELKLDQITSINGGLAGTTNSIFIDEWIRPIHKNHKKILIVEKALNTSNYEWKVASKEYIKSIS